VARCRLSGILIGPPNHHSYPEALRQIHLARFPDLPFEEYSRRVEMIHDPALIEQWKEESRKQTVFKPRQAEGEAAKPVKRAEAETWLLQNVVPSLIARSRRMVLPRRLAAAVQERSLRRAFIAAWRRERQFPASLMFALRGAFRHRHLFTFKTARGATFVSAIEPAPLQTDHVVEPIRELLAYLRDHPESKAQDLVQGLRPGLAPDSPEAAKLLAPLRWLVDKGHIVEFSNGTLSAPGERGREERAEAEEPKSASAPAPAQEAPPAVTHP
jgi:hypothetical protein